MSGDVTRMLVNFDQFRVVSRDLTKGTFSGGAFTAIAYAALLLLFIAELGSFLRKNYQTNILMDQNNDELIQINFDILMYDLPCKYMKIGVWDKFGEEKMNSSDQFHYIPVDHKGDHKGMAYTKEELTLLEKADAVTDVTEGEKKELDADWSSSSDHFKHQDFHAAVTFHEFTLVNFFAEWCSHCRKFSPMWNEAADRISEKMAFKDGDGKETTVKFLKMNCVDFQGKCQEEKIQAFPSLRLYKRDGTFEQFQNKRSVENIIEFITNTVKNSHQMVAKHHAMFDQGCQVQGWLNVPRVPGHFAIQAEAHGDVNVNPALVNVSHSIRHLSFGLPDAKSWAERQQIPKEMLKHIQPLDNQQFTVEHFHEAPQHYLKVVSTKVDGQSRVFYQMTHTDRVRTLQKNSEKPTQARFSYDFSPMSVVVKEKSKRWYEFLTSLFAILGGTFTIVELSAGAVDTVGTAVKEAMGKAN
mmetsp:Transcript_9656/g.17366  ORF Transcript_9656/g.17366 Transcript_9656/m.17366 type:complete len:469 (-) Transcript_9656:190-1596(-)|eukprot:CAMPEP_0197654840 /NCGR_PEP_ID=MMETSP1338-20131121/39089_1 /TAXON_ID=43686 ORGANISM="Pelagodinium beii, Strain RCC1491" /NCGR_SAMPLE_ID=MMETSP1338 /ASSEMBLY_ACC=CAM_ASM_000754 /LENGTH=468 /DNA_ID=CAMNT_0043230359 /DNA_START=124 /DNA_END=1530 /DNA_ORIENTATION=-